jgi:hypothetical protein
MKVNLPCELSVTDYHEFYFLRLQLRKIIPGVKVKELAFDGRYFGMAYYGKLSDPENSKMAKRIKAKNDSDFG